MADAAKYQVFVSSTFEDLIEERDQVIKATLEMGHIPVGMEMFSAADEEQWQIIARHIDQSDYYVVLIAHRYGSMTDDGISYTRKEYEYARKQGIPTLGFVIDDAASWPPDRIDMKPTVKAALDELKAIVKEKPVSFWSSADDLHSKFSIALMKAITATPRPGWVRATELAGPEVAAEIVRLSSENAALRKSLKDAEEEAGADQRAEMQQTIQTIFATKRSPSYRYSPTGEWQRDVEITLFRVFNVLGPSLVVEASIQDLAGTLAMEIRTDRKRSWDIVALNQVRGLMADLMTLDLVHPSTKRHAVNDENEYWSLSSNGVELLKRARKLSLTTTDSTEAPEDEEPSDPAASAEKAPDSVDV